MVEAPCSAGMLVCQCEVVLVSKGLASAKKKGRAIMWLFGQRSDAAATAQSGLVVGVAMSSHSH